MQAVDSYCRLRLTLAMTTSAEEFLKTLPDAAAVAALASVGASESLHFDAKRCAEPLNKDDKNNLAAALSGFANSDGGVLIYGLVAAGGDKGKGIPDVVTGVDPIKRLNSLTSELNSLVGQLTQPPVSNTRILAREFTAQNDTGFILVHVPASDAGPHRSARDHEYYRRHGSGFYLMEHFELAEVFGSRRRPQLEIYWNLRVGATQGTATHRIFHTFFIVGLQNIGRGIARFPGLVLSGERNQLYGLDGNGNFGLPKRPRSDQNKLIFGGGADDVVYPDSILEITALMPTLLVAEDSLNFDTRILRYELYAENMLPVRSELTIDQGMLRECFLKIQPL
jgi:hypothetical protein